MVINKTPKIIKETIFDSFVLLNKNTNEVIKKRNSTMAEKSWPNLNGYIDKEVNLEIAWTKWIKLVLNEKFCKSNLYNSPSPYAHWAVLWFSLIKDNNLK